MREKNGSQEQFNKFKSEHRFVSKFSGPINGMVPIRFPSHISRKAALMRLQNDPRIIHIEPDYRVFVLDRLPDDPFVRRQWALYNLHDGIRMDVGAPEAWKITKGSRRVVLAIIDTGIDYLHPDLKANMWINQDELPGNHRDDDGNGYIDDVYGYNFNGDNGDPMDNFMHGTLVGSLAGAVTDNGVGIAGLCPHVSLMAVKGLGDTGFGYSSDLIASIYYAVDNGARVINASWGGGGYMYAMTKALEYAASHNVIFVAAAGNSHRDNDTRPFYPSSYTMDNIVSVGASDYLDRPAGFSHWGRQSVDLYAPGHNIVGAIPGGGYMFNSGTSLAAPYVAGALCLLVAIAPEIAYQDYIALLLNSIHKIPQFEKLCVSGGRLDAIALLENRNVLFKSVKAGKTFRSVLSILAGTYYTEE
ncbi:MAG: S8 family serine peptidase [Fibrobacteria bacterium]|nr:S8 family serine peptidase [Fibrobacteria bacterium]